MDSRYGADQSGFLELQSTSNAWFLVLTKSLAINFDFKGVTSPIECIVIDRVCTKELVAIELALSLRTGSQVLA
jgi:hypothetical protein